MSKLLPLDLFIRQALLYPLISPFLPPVNKVEKDYSYAAGKRIGTLEVGGEPGLPKTGQTVKYLNNDDGDLERGLPLVGARFTDNEDGTISDIVTGLMWIGNLAGAGINDTYNFGNAILECTNLTYAGHSDWRLPNRFELLTILDLGRDSPAINPIFVTCRNTFYWSSTTAHWIDTSAFPVDFEYGSVTIKPKTYVFYIRPVRLGPV